MRKPVGQLLCLLLLAGSGIGIFVVNVFGNANTGKLVRPAVESYPEGAFLSRRDSAVDSSSIYTLQSALPFAAVAGVVVALSIYAFYADRRRKRQD